MLRGHLKNGNHLRCSHWLPCWTLNNFWLYNNSFMIADCITVNPITECQCLLPTVIKNAKYQTFDSILNNNKNANILIQVFVTPQWTHHVCLMQPDAARCSVLITLKISCSHMYYAQSNAVSFEPEVSDALCQWCSGESHCCVESSMRWMWLAAAMFVLVIFQLMTCISS